MSFDVSTLFNLYRFPSGRRHSCLIGMRDHLEHGAFDDLRARLDRAIEAERATRQLEVAFRASRRGRSDYSPEASEIDAELDRTLGTLDESLAATIKGYGPDSPKGQAAALTRERLFPQGVRVVVHMPYAEQEAEVGALLERAEQDLELSRALHALGQDDLIARIAALNLRYGEAIRGRGEAPSYDDVRAARVAGQERLCWLLLRIAARLEDAPVGSEEAARLAAAIDVVLDENAAIRRYRKRRRNGTDAEDPEDAEDAQVEEAEPDAEAA